jgi:hypothetical protein
MNRVITFSRTFPAYHPQAGHPTFFVEKLFKSIGKEYHTLPNEIQDIVDAYTMDSCIPKHQTIRAGKRWKVGDMLRPRAWGDNINPKNGRKGPYQSNQIAIAPDIEVKKVWDIKIIDSSSILINGFDCSPDKLCEVAENDGLEKWELLKWLKFPAPFTGQIICWNDKIEY